MSRCDSQVLVDVPRTCPSLPSFHTDFVQRSLERVLFIWAMRHPASGYVQGINDIVTPFYTVMFEERGVILDAKRRAGDDGDGSGDASGSGSGASDAAALERLGDDALMEVEADVCVRAYGCRRVPLQHGWPPFVYRGMGGGVYTGSVHMRLGCGTDTVVCCFCC